MRATRTEQALKIVKRMGVVRPKDLAPHGIAPVYLRRLLKTGDLVQSARGLSKLAERKETPYHRLAEAFKLIPNGGVCLLSALYFHDLGKQHRAILMAIDHKARKPAIEGMPVRFVRFSGAGMRRGIERHEVEGVPVHVTSCSRTVADCFRHRNKIGFDVALEALRGCNRKRRSPKAELLRCAKACRISSVIQPDVEALA